jgi:hypothetical protein
MRDFKKNIILDAGFDLNAGFIANLWRDIGKWRAI